MRRLLLLTLAAVGCQTLPAEPEPRPQPPAQAAETSASSDLLLCAAPDPNAAAPPAPANPVAEAPALLPTPQKLESAVPDSPTTPLEDRPPVTLRVLEQLALSSNPTLPQAQALIQQQQGLATQVGLYPNPQAGYLRTDADQSGQSQTDGVFLSQEIVTAGKLRLAVQAERQDVRIRDWQLNAQQRRVLNDVRIRFYEALGAQQAAHVAAEFVRMAEQGCAAIAQLLENNQASRPDLLQAEIQLSTARTALQDAQYRVEAAWRQLASVVGVPDLPPAPLAGLLEADLPQLDWKTSLQELLQNSPLLKAQEAEIRASQLEVRLARAQAIPNVSVQLVAQRDHIMKYSTVSTLVSMPVPFFNRNQGNIINARGILRQQQAEYERLRLALQDQLAASFRAYQTLRTQAERLRTEIVPRAKENLELTMKGYELRRFDFPRVLAARQTYAQASLSAIDALTELHKVLVEIKGLQLSGGLNPTEIGTALQTTPGAATSTGLRGVLFQQLQEQRSAPLRNLPGAVQGEVR
jgi:cobalt-zinc-cadmium efflux system outer membrane protein